jgi:flagellar biosynthesis GTPase FlhF
MYDRLCKATVDWNDLRVCMPEEIVSLSGDKSPEAIERATRLKMTLRAVYRRNHEVTLDPELGARRREAKSSIEALEGIPSYAAARVLSVCFEVPIVPVDSQVRELLLAKGAVHADATEDDISKWLTKLVKATDVLDVHARLQSWVDTSHESMQTTRRKAGQADLRAAKKRRDQSKIDRAARQVARVKAIAERKKAAEEKARLREVRKIEAEARKARAQAEAEKAEKKKAAAKKIAKRSSSKKKAAAKKVAKRPSSKKKAAAKKVAKRSPSRKKAAAKKVAKRTTSKKTKKSTTKKTAARRKTSSRR